MVYNYYKQNASIETRALQLFKVAEFLEDYFNQKYGEEVFQARCLWCKVQLDQTFFDKLTTASQCQDTEQRTKIMEEIHIYVEDFLISYCEMFFKTLDDESKTYIIYAANFLHSRMEEKKLMNFFRITGMLK